MKLTTLEQTVLDALKQNAEDCSGGDFAIVEELKAPKGMTRQAMGGVITNLVTKRIIRVDVTYVNGNEKVTQVTFK